MERRYCAGCGEPLPPYSRICPICEAGEGFSRLSCRFDRPMKHLHMMRGYLDELLALPKLTLWQSLCSLLMTGQRDPYREQIMEIHESFEIIKTILDLHFADHDDIIEASSLMSELLHAEINRRKHLFCR